jgi:cytochrome P450 / NADPH-cytochrome P450 reductase
VRFRHVSSDLDSADGGLCAEMDDIASQLMLKWARQGPDHKILASEDFSRLTLDTIALCTMDYRFNSFYTDDMHPFVQAMNRVFTELNSQDTIGGTLRNMIPGHKEQLTRDNEFILQTGADIVKRRREHPVEKKDLLNAMLYTKDPKTGLTMRDDLIVANMKTFLIAGT